MNRKCLFFDQFWIRIFSAAIFLIFIFFAGCSGEVIFDTIFPRESPSSTNEPADDLNVTATPPASETLTGEGNQTVATTPEATQEFTVEKNELVVWVPEEFSNLVDSPAAEIFNQRIADFERQNPGTVVVLRVKASSGSGGILDSLRSTKVAATGALPHIALLSRVDMENAEGLALLLPVEEYSHDTSPSTYFSYAREISELDGIMYGFPFVGDALVGIADESMSDIDVPTWDEVRARKIPLYFAANSPQATFFISQYQSTNGLLVDEQGHGTFVDENFLTVLNTFDQNLKKGIFQETFNALSTNEDVWTQFRNGNARWVINWYSKAMQSDLSGLQIFQIPSLDSEPYVSAKGWLWTIVDRDAEVNETILEFVTFFSDARFLADYSQAAGFLPVLPASLEVYEDGDMIVQLNTILTASHALPANDLILELGPVFRDATLMVMSQDYSMEEIVEISQRQIEALQTK